MGAGAAQQSIVGASVSGLAPNAAAGGGGGKSPVARRRRHATASSDIVRSPRGGGAPSGASSRGRARHRARRLTSSPPLPPPSGPLFAAATETASTSAAAVAAVGAVAKLHGIVVRPADVRSGGHSAGRAGRCDGHAIRQGATNARCASPPLQLVRRRRARAVVHERRRRRRRLSWRRRRALSTRKPQARAMCRAYLRVPPSAESAQWLFDSGADAREAGSRRLKSEVLDKCAHSHDQSVSQFRRGPPVRAHQNTASQRTAPRLPSVNKSTELTSRSLGLLITQISISLRCGREVGLSQHIGSLVLAAL